MQQIWIMDLDFFLNVSNSFLSISVTTYLSN